MSLDYQDIDKDNQEFEEKFKKQKDKKQRQAIWAATKIEWTKIIERKK